MSPNIHDLSLQSPNCQPTKRHNDDTSLDPIKNPKRLRYSAHQPVSSKPFNSISRLRSLSSFNKYSQHPWFYDLSSLLRHAKGCWDNGIVIQNSFKDKCEDIPQPCVCAKEECPGQKCCSSSLREAPAFPSCESIDIGTTVLGEQKMAAITDGNVDDGDEKDDKDDKDEKEPDEDNNDASYDEYLGYDTDDNTEFTQQDREERVRRWLDEISAAESEDSMSSRLAGSLSTYDWHTMPSFVLDDKLYKHEVEDLIAH